MEAGWLVAAAGLATVLATAAQLSVGAVLAVDMSDGYEELAVRPCEVARQTALVSARQARAGCASPCQRQAKRAQQRRQQQQ